MLAPGEEPGRAETINEQCGLAGELAGQLTERGKISLASAIGIAGGMMLDRWGGWLIEFADGYNRSAVSGQDGAR